MGKVVKGEIWFIASFHRFLDILKAMENYN